MYHDILFRTFSLSLSLASAQYKSALTILSSRLADHQHRNWFYSCWLYHCCSFDVCAQAELYAAMMWRSYFYAREIPECRCKQSGRQSALIAPRVISLFHFKVFIIAPIFIQPIIFVFCCCFFFFRWCQSLNNGIEVSFEILQPRSFAKYTRNICNSLQLFIFMAIFLLTMFT